LHEYFLRQIFRKIACAQHAQRQTVDGALMRLDQGRERGPLAAARQRDLFVQNIEDFVIQARDCYINRLTWELPMVRKCK
jgi:hypothetical protein